MPGSAAVLPVASSLGIHACGARLDRYAPVLGNGTFYLEDRTGRLDVDEVLALPPERFRAVEGGHVNEGKNSSTWWLRAGSSNCSPSR